MARRKKSEQTESVAEMEAKASDLEKEIFALRNDLAVQRKLEKPHLLKAKRHERARILTLLTQQKRKAT
jgi:ribosomal protein L29